MDGKEMILSQVEQVKQREYIPLIREFACEVLEKYKGRLYSVVLFGSAARGVARKNSDLDFLVVVKDLPENYSQRVEEISQIIEKVTQTKLTLWEHGGIFANIEAIILTPEEAAINQPIYLDMITDSVIIYDRKDFMKNTLSKLRKKLEEMGAKKIITPKGDWYWQLKDKVKRGEVLKI